MVIAHYSHSSSGGSNWYEVPVNQMTADLLQYFQMRASLKPDFCKIDDEKVRWCTSFEWADKLSLSTFISSAGKLCLKTQPILSAQDRKAMVTEQKEKYSTPSDKVVKGNIEVDDLDFE